MRNAKSNSQPAPDSRAWVQILARYREPSLVRSALEIAITAVPLAVLWIVMWRLLDVSYWLCLPLAIPAAGLLIRLFIIQHDCGHGAFFRSRLANDWIGRVLGVMTLTPYDMWRHTHAVHHATSGNLERRGTGDIDLLTVREYQALSPRGRLGYRLYRHPIVMFLLGPAYYFVLRQRLPIGLTQGRQLWLSVMATNAATALLVATIMWFVGVGPFLLVQLPIIAVACSIGGWVFFIQHQFEDTVWDADSGWNFHEAALHGSSYYDLPGVLRWFTANIGVHHVHHLCSRIPYYRLPEVLRDHPELAAIGRLTLVRSLRCARMAVWDEDRRCLISFHEMRYRYGRTQGSRTETRGLAMTSQWHDDSGALKPSPGKGSARRNILALAFKRVMAPTAILGFSAIQLAKRPVEPS